MPSYITLRNVIVIMLGSYRDVSYSYDFLFSFGLKSFIKNVSSCLLCSTSSVCSLQNGNILYFNVSLEHLSKCSLSGIFRVFVSRIMYIYIPVYIS